MDSLNLSADSAASMGLFQASDLPSGSSLINADPFSLNPLSSSSAGRSLPTDLRDNSSEDVRAFGDRQQRLLPRSKKGIKRTIRGKRERVVGTAGNDRLNASRGKGQNTLVGKGGNDRLWGRRRDTLLGGGGNDRLDTRRGRRNTLRGGGGRDRLFVGKRDQAFGNGGADILDGSRGGGGNVLNGGGGSDRLIGLGDRLVGGNGADQFVLADGVIPAQISTVADFSPGEDRLIVNLPGVNNVSDVTLTQQGNDTAIAVQGQQIAILENIAPAQLSDADFQALEPTLTVAIADTTVIEGNPGDAQTARFTIALNRPSASNVILSYATVSLPGQAIANTDYSPVQGTLTIPAGTASATITVPIIGDFQDESDETLRLQLSTVTGARVVKGNAIATIRDDENESITTQNSNQFSTASTDETSILYQFNLVNETDQGQPIVDGQPNDPDRATFVGAIQDYQSGSGQLKGIGSDTFFEFNPNGSTTFASGTLTARRIDAPNPDDVQIEYSIIPPGTTVPDLIFKEEVSQFPTLAEPLDVNLAVNSLAYIIDNNLLDQGFEPSVLSPQFDFFMGHYNTRQSKRYANIRTDLDGNATVLKTLTVVDRTDPSFDDGFFGSDVIDDTNASPTVGRFVGAIEAYEDVGSGVAIALGTLTATRSGDQITYTIANLDNTLSVSAAVDVVAGAIDGDQATNSLEYILENDVLKLAFF